MAYKHTPGSESAGSILGILLLIAVVIIMAILLFTRPWSDRDNQPTEPTNTESTQEDPVVTEEDLSELEDILIDIESEQAQNDIVSESALLEDPEVQPEE